MNLCRRSRIQQVLNIFPYCHTTVGSQCSFCLLLQSLNVPSALGWFHHVLKECFLCTFACAGRNFPFQAEMCFSCVPQNSLTLMSQQERDPGPQGADSDGVNIDERPEMNFTDADFPTISNASTSQPGTSAGAAGGRWVMAGKAWLCSGNIFTSIPTAIDCCIRAGQHLCK